MVNDTDFHGLDKCLPMLDAAIRDIDDHLHHQHYYDNILPDHDLHEALSRLQYIRDFLHHYIFQDGYLGA
jgi:hypothetical protein